LQGGLLLEQQQMQKMLTFKNHDKSATHQKQEQMPPQLPLPQKIYAILEANQRKP